MRAAPKLVMIAAGAMLCLLVAPFVGMEWISPAALWSNAEGPMDATILWDIRVPRVLTGFLAGAALAVGGMAFQAVFHNPLATPFTLGVSSGASLGTALALRFGISFAIFGIPAESMFGFAGAGLSIGLVYGLARAKPGFTTGAMLLAGVAISFFFSSLILFVQYTADVFNSFRLLRWLMGGITVLGYDPVLTLLPFTLTAAFALFFLSHELNLLTIGDDLAMARGVDVPRVKRIMFIVVSLVVGGVVSICGPIGFIGMMAPHMCRLVVGENHRVLLPATFLFGGAFLVVCDTAARTVLAPAEVPVGVITAFLGGPFFLWLLLTRPTDRSIG